MPFSRSRGISADRIARCRSRQASASVRDPNISRIPSSLGDAIAKEIAPQEAIEGRGRDDEPIGHGEPDDPSDLSQVGHLAAGQGGVAGPQPVQRQNQRTGLVVSLILTFPLDIGRYAAQDVVQFPVAIILYGIQVPGHDEHVGRSTAHGLDHRSQGEGPIPQELVLDVGEQLEEVVVQVENLAETVVHQPKVVRAAERGLVAARLGLSQAKTRSQKARSDLLGWFSSNIYGTP